MNIVGSSSTRSLFPLCLRPRLLVGLAFSCIWSVVAPAQTNTSQGPASKPTTAPQSSPAAQSNAQSNATNNPQTTLSVQARLVTLPVTVRDKRGKIVTSLTKEDFTLTEDGRPETIKYLNIDTNLPITLGLLVDTSGSMRDALDRERSASKSFLDQMLAKPTDKAFLLHFDSEVELLEDLTSSKDKLERALEQLGPTSEHLDSSSSSDDSQSGGQRQPRTHGGTTLYDAIYLASDDLMRKQQGRKALIVLSDGEDRGSKETLGTAIEAAQRAETVVYAIYFKGEDHSNNYNPLNNGGGRRGGMGGGYPGGGYPGGGGGYPGGRGGGGQRPSEEPHVDGKKIMAQIAGETGGWFFEAKKKENLDDIYAQISEQLRTQYVLGYTPDKDSTLTGFHKVQLTVKKKDLSVQTRPGYYADR